MGIVITLIVVVFTVFAMFLLLASSCTLLFLRDCYDEVDPTNDDNAIRMQPISMSQTNICVEYPTHCEDNKRHSI